MQKVHLGKDSFNELETYFQKYNPGRILLVRGNRSYEECGAKAMIEKLLLPMNCETISFSGFRENPQYEDLQKGLNLIQDQEVDLILAVGGGSVMDMAKLIRFFHAYEGVPEIPLYVPKKDPVPLVVLPTTAGTGCESTHFAVIYKNKVKYSVAHPEVLPDVAIIDPLFTYNNPAYLTACTGFDALAQAIEAFWNRNATEESDRYARKAIELLWSNLPEVVNHPGEESRGFVSEGSYWAGKAINITKTSAPHAVSYAFTSYYGYPHGHAVALSFPFFARKNFQFNVSGTSWDSSKKEQLLTMLNVNDVNLLPRLLTEYLENIHLPLQLKVAVDKETILQSVNLDRLTNNPYPVCSKDIEQFVESLLLME